MFGEHAVVYGQPGIALPVLDLYTKISIRKSDTFSYSVDRVLHEHEKTRLEQLLNLIFLKLKISNNVHINIESTLPISSGLGSSASLSIAIIKALNQHYYLKFSLKKISLIGYECEKIFHGKPSGIDNNVVAYEKPVYFQKPDLDFIKLRKPMFIVIASTGGRPSTKQVVSEVREKYEKNQLKYSIIFEDIGKIVKKAKQQLEQGNLTELGKLMTKNHELLKEMGVSSEKLDLLIEISLQNNAYGAKLAGAGKGGNIIALVDNENKDTVINELKVLSNEVMCTEVR